MTKRRRRRTPDQIIRKLAEGNRLLAAGITGNEKHDAITHPPAG